MTSRMFSFITKTWNPIAGGCFIEDDEIYACPYRCSYCWARALINKWKGGNLGKKYIGPYRIQKRIIDQKFRPGDFVAVQFMSDIGASEIPVEVVEPVLDAMSKQPEVDFLLLTKSDGFYYDYRHAIPYNCVCGITMETDLAISAEITLAPHPDKRLNSLIYLKCIHPEHRTFISIEPIMPFSVTFAGKIRKAEPWRIAIGYDNYDNRLPEPTQDETRKLIKNLNRFTKVDLKTIRRAWHEGGP